MSNLLSQASLVMIPSGYKEDVVYSQIPTSGAGDLSFTRASNGTRINSAGLVEVTPWNFLEQSETFDSGTWSKTGVTVTANTTTAPNGTTTADTLVFGASSNEIVQSVGNLVVDQTYTLTIYLRVASGTATMYWGNIDYTTPTITVTTEWQRFTVTQQAAATTRYPKLVSSSAMTVFAWGAQLNIGATAKPYFPTTDRLNVPRLTYQNGGGGCPSLLLEKQSTNEALESNTLTTNPNVVDFSTTTANVYVSPDGTQNAMRFTETTANNRHGFYQYTTVTAQTYTASIFTKQTGRRYISFDSDITGTSATSFFDLQTISVVSSGSGHTCSIQDFGNGWLRLIVTFTASVGSRYVIWGGSPNGTTNSYAGSTSISQTFYGYQLEASSYPTSYIPTTSSSATRVADVCNKFSITSLIGQTEGTIFGQVAFPNLGAGGDSSYIYITDGSFTNSVIIGREPASPNSKLFFYINAGGTNILNNQSNNLQSGFVKMAIGYKSGNWAAYLNGTLVASGTSTFTFSANMTRFGIGTNDGGITIMSDSMIASQAVLFPTRLTNAELASLTTI